MNGGRKRNMKAAVLKEYRNFIIDDVPKPRISENQVLVRSEYAGICGSDMHIFNGDFHPRTQVPFIPGHEFAGTIVETGSNVRSFKTGDMVAVDPIIWCGKCAACQLGHYPACTSLKLLGVDLDGGFGEYVAANENMLYKLEPHIPAKHAALVEVYSIGFHACNRAGLKKDDTAVIWGTGRIGQSVLQAARTITSNKIICIDIIDSRLENAKRAYTDIVTVNLLKEDPISVIKESTDGRGVDVAFEVVGHAESISNQPNPVAGCIKSIRGAGTVCVLGLGDNPSPILMKELIWKEAKIIASRVSHGEFRKAIDNLNAGKLKPESLISAEFELAYIQNAFELIKEAPEKYLKILLKITQSDPDY